EVLVRDYLVLIRRDAQVRGGAGDDVELHRLRREVRRVVLEAQGEGARRLEAEVVARGDTPHHQAGGGAGQHRSVRTQVLDDVLDRDGDAAAGVGDGVAVLVQHAHEDGRDGLARVGVRRLLAHGEARCGTGSEDDVLGG